eukprot:1139983-Pelagomonas_calceolata.AAC.1
MPPGVEPWFSSGFLSSSFGAKRSMHSSQSNLESLLVVPQLALSQGAAAIYDPIMPLLASVGDVQRSP